MRCGSMLKKKHYYADPWPAPEGTLPQCKISDDEGRVARTALAGGEG